jgi:hypothetical protein
MLGEKKTQKTRRVMSLWIRETSGISSIGESLYGL